VSYFTFFVAWDDALEASGSPVPPESRVSPYTGSGYVYPCTFIAVPEYWNRRSRTGPEQWGKTAVHQVLFPSKKALVIDSGVIWLPGQDYSGLWFLASYVDGSAARSSGPGEGYPFGDGVYPGSIHFDSANLGLHTIDGVRGVDR
jgi:hypothetical protein